MKVTNIECSIKNLNSSIYKKIVFRKFFQILFFDENMKKIDIYTASIFGGSKDGSDEINYSNFYSTIDDKFKIKFVFNIKDMNSDSYHIESKDCTNNFLEQVDKTKIIWGNLSERISEQKDIEGKLQQILGTYKNYNNCANKESCSECEKDKDCKEKGYCLKHKCDRCNNYKLIELIHTNTSDNDYLYVSDDDKKEISLAIEGENEINDEKNCFTIQGINNLHSGVEVLNWVHTAITFNEKQYIELFKYKIKFPAGELMTSDFTLYIGPQEGYTLNRDSSTLKIEDGNSILNSFQEVGKYEELYYTEWKENCNILNKKMHRALLKDKLFNSDDKKFKGNRIELSVSIKDEVGRDDFHFIFGIVVSTILAFGIDYTRMGQLKNCFIPLLIMPDVQWIFTCVLILYAIWKSRLCKKSAKSRKSHKVMTRLWRTGIMCFGIWVIATFIVYQGFENGCYPWYLFKKLPANMHFWVRLIYWIALALVWMSCGIYIVLSNTKLKKDYLSKKLLDIKLFLKN